MLDIYSFTKLGLLTDFFLNLLNQKISWENRWNTTFLSKISFTFPRSTFPTGSKFRKFHDCNNKDYAGDHSVWHSRIRISSPHVTVVFFQFFVILENNGTKKFWVYEDHHGSGALRLKHLQNITPNKMLIKS